MIAVVAELVVRFMDYIGFFFFFFKQKTAYEIVSRDWSSDVCSSDLYWVEPDASDVVIFYDHELTSTPPRKIPGEAQITLDVDHMENWDGYFNYIHDFRQDSFIRMYAKGYKKLGIPYTRNFTAEKLKKIENKYAAGERPMVCIKLSYSPMEV